MLLGLSYTVLVLYAIILRKLHTIRVRYFICQINVSWHKAKTTVGRHLCEEGTGRRSKKLPSTAWRRLRRADFQNRNISRSRTCHRRCLVAWVSLQHISCTFVTHLGQLSLSSYWVLAVTPHMCTPT